MIVEVLQLAFQAGSLGPTSSKKVECDSQDI
jgi:hypothetical protein